MNEAIFLILNRFAQEIRRAAIQRYRNHDANNSTDNISDTEIANHYLQKFVDLKLGASTPQPTYAINIDTFSKKLCRGKKNEEIINIQKGDLPIKTLIVLINYVSGNSLTDGVSDNPDLVNIILTNLSGFNSAIMKYVPKQLELLGYKLDGLFYYYLLYYSRGGDETPDVALLKINEEWNEAILLFQRKPSTHIGTIHHDNSDNIFIKFVDDETRFVSLISVTHTEKQKLAEVGRFDGFYASALRERGIPVAGKLIIIKSNKEDSEKTLSSGLIPPKISVELLNERFKYQEHPPVDGEKLLEYIGIYEGYWFRVQNKGVIVTMAFEIKEDGTVILQDDEGIEKGYVHLLDDEHKVLKCSFNFKDVHNYRITFIFKIHSNPLKKYDGLYSGQGAHYTDITAGKIRIYKTEKTFDEIKKILIPFDEADKSISERGPELIDFFWGKERLGSHNNVIQPNFEFYKHSFDKKTDGLDTSMSNSADIYCGYYVMSKLDSDKKRINLYNVVIDINGRLSYSLELNPPSKYEGVVKYINDCLVMSVFKIDDKDYSANYIFYTEGKRPEDFKYLMGTYSAVVSAGKTPICGRTILYKVNGAEPKFFPITIGSKEYYNPPNYPKDLIKFLSCIENNLIKSKKSTDKAERDIDYGDIFFVYAGQQTELKMKIDFLKLALQNGFSDLKRLETEIKKSHLENSIKITKGLASSNSFQVSSIVKDSKWVYPEVFFV